MTATGEKRRVLARDDRIPLAIGAVAWGALLLLMPPSFDGALPFGAHGSAHAGSGELPAAGAPVAAEFWSTWGIWMLMSLAMMVPTTIVAVRYVRRASLPRRRVELTLTFLVAYLVVWAALGAAVATVLAGRPLLGVLGSVVVLTACAIWELTVVKRRALRRCHRTAPLRLQGVAASKSTALFGLRHGAWCVLACGPAMCAIAAMGHPLVVMLAAGIGLGWEKVARAGDRLRPFVAAGALTAAIAVVITT